MQKTLPQTSPGGKKEMALFPRFINGSINLIWLIVAMGIESALVFAPDFTRLVAQLYILCSGNVYAHADIWNVDLQSCKTGFGFTIIGRARSLRVFW